MGRHGDDTRAQLVDAATRVFADQGVYGGSLLEITRLAGQRNRGAVHYHFGSRDGILVAVLAQHVGFLARREGELLDAARALPDDAVEPVIEAIVRPIVELTEIDWRGACFLRIVRELVEQDPATVGPDVLATIEQTGGAAVYELLRQRIRALPDDLRDERLALMTYFVLQSAADRASASERPTARRAPLPAERFIANLVAMAAGMLAAPVPDTAETTETTETTEPAQAGEPRA